MSGGGAAGEHGAGLALVRPGHCQRGGAVRGQRQSEYHKFIDSAQRTNNLNLSLSKRTV